LTVLSLRQFRALTWALAFEDRTTAVHIKVFKAEGHDDVAIIHEIEAGKRTRVRYNFAGRKFDSPSQAVNHWNETRGAGRRRGPIAPGSVEPAAARKGALPGR
jgi:hypothetical protein